MEGGEEEFLVGDVLSLDEDDPGQRATRKLDWEALLNGLSIREKGVFEQLLAGHTASEIARSFKLDPSTIKYFKQRLALKILDCFGQDILREVVRRPGWKNVLTCERERLACRNSRKIEGVASSSNICWSGWFEIEDRRHQLLPRPHQSHHSPITPSPAHPTTQPWHFQVLAMVVGMPKKPHQPSLFHWDFTGPII